MPRGLRLVSRARQLVALGVLSVAISAVEPVHVGARPAARCGHREVALITPGQRCVVVHLKRPPNESPLALTESLQLDSLGGAAGAPFDRDLEPDQATLRHLALASFSKLSQARTAPGPDLGDSTRRQQTRAYAADDSTISPFVDDRGAATGASADATTTLPAGPERSGGTAHMNMVLGGTVNCPDR